MDGVEDESILLDALRGDTTGSRLREDLHNRLLRAVETESASDLDRAILVRQLLRRMSLRDGRNVPVEVAPTIARSIRRVASTAGLRERGDRWFADAWRPDWLELNGAEPDAAAMAGTVDGHRFHEDLVVADPFFAELAGYQTYRTAGQRAVARAVMSVPAGATVIGMLPTGSGKTEIALCLAGRNRLGVTVIVVPTVALAYDFERRFRAHYARRNARIRPESLHFAWTGSTSEATRAALRARVEQGQQPILVTSPESMTRSLRQTLLDAARVGRLQGFVVDEAHLVTQWGRDFRPEFRTLADLRRDLLAASGDAGHTQPVTLLLSATIGDAEFDDLVGLFGSPGPRVPVMANALRAEPDIWIAHASDREERERWVLDALAHSARPAVLYVTKPASATEWLQRLREVGYRRVAEVTGSTPAQDRVSVLEGLRADADPELAVDLVVATAAFGLGIDYPHIRTVIHACLPETVDRWYQELGRGGRDGDAAAAFLLTAPGDHQEAASLGTTVLRPDTARDRWKDLWKHRRKVGDRVFIDLEGSRGVGRGDYNRRWNAQLVQGLVELGDLTREQFDVEELRELLDDDAAESSDWTAITLASARLGISDYWTRVWQPWQQSEAARSNSALGRILDVSAQRVAACEGIARAYAPDAQTLKQWGGLLQFMEPLGPCGRCPHCRATGIAPNTDPPPAPAQVWAVDSRDYTGLGAFARASRAVNGVAILTYSPGEAEIAGTIADRLVALGVRHLAGVSLANPALTGSPLFIDERPAAPIDLTPFPSFSYFGQGQRVSGSWLSRRAAPRVDASGSPLVDTLLVPVGARISGRSVGRDLPSVSAITASELLGVK